jgi:hypothetical protein
MGTLLTGQQVTSALCPVNKAFFFLRDNFFFMCLLLQKNIPAIPSTSGRLHGEFVRLSAAQGLAQGKSWSVSH